MQPPAADGRVGLFDVPELTSCSVTSMRCLGRRVGVPLAAVRRRTRPSNCAMAFSSSRTCMNEVLELRHGLVALHGRELQEVCNGRFPHAVP